MTRTRMVATAAMALTLAAALAGSLEAVEPSPLGTTKHVESMRALAEGTFEIVYAIVAENLGATELGEIQIVDDLADAFPPEVAFEVLGIKSEAAIRNDYDGRDVIEMLDGTAVLPPGASIRVELTVRVQSAVPDQSLRNTASARGVTPSGELVSDASQDGDVPDPDGDGDPANDNAPTTVQLTPRSRIGAAKAAAFVRQEADGTYTVRYDLRVKNYGNTVLKNVQIQESLIAAFPAPARAAVVSVRSTTLATNAAYDGFKTVRLLADTNRLEPGAEGKVELTISVAPNGGLAWFDNRAFVTAEDAFGAQTSDLSQDGHDPDPDGDGDPSNNDEYTDLFLAAVSAGGSMELTVHGIPSPLAIDLPTVRLTAFLEIEGFTARLDARIADRVFDKLTASLDGTLSEWDLSSVATFDPSSVSFESWQSAIAFDVFGLNVEDTLLIRSPQSSSYNLLHLSGTTAGFALDGRIKAGVCPWAFWEASICADWQWPYCDVPLSACLSFTDVLGFQHLAVSAADIPLFEDLYGIEGSLDVNIDYGLDQKSISPTLQLEPDWLICPEIRLLGEIVLSNAHLGIEGVLFYGIEAEVSIGDVRFRFADSLVDSKNTAVTGNASYFELLGVEGPIPACCGSTGQFAVDLYFERAPSPSGALFGVGLLDAAFETRVSEHLAFGFEGLFTPVIPFVEFTLTFTLLW